MKIAIDALNIRSGGGLTHLREFIDAISTFDRNLMVHLYCNQMTASKLSRFHWLYVITPPAWSESRLGVAIWRKFILDQQLARLLPDVLFVPGGTYLGSFRPFVVMAQNLLPFMPGERARMGFSLRRCSFHLLEQVQGSTFRRATRVIHMSQYARVVVDRRARLSTARTSVVYHGVNERFRISNYSSPLLNLDKSNAVFRWLYVSVIDAYKHQSKVAEAASILLREGFQFNLDFIGPGKPSDVVRLQSAIKLADPSGQSVKYLGSVSYNSIAKAYLAANGFVFASSCETFGLIVLEAMAMGLPLAASNRSSIPEIVGNAGIFFDPESPLNIAIAMRRIMTDGSLRAQLSANAIRRASDFSWAKCAQETLLVLEAAVVESHHN